MIHYFYSKYTFKNTYINHNLKTSDLIPFNNIVSFHTKDDSLENFIKYKSGLKYVYSIDKNHDLVKKHFDKDEYNNFVEMGFNTIDKLGIHDRYINYKLEELITTRAARYIKYKYNLYTGPYFLMNKDPRSPVKEQIYCIMMVKKEYVRYLHLCQYFDELPDVSIFQFWVDEDVLKTSFKPCKIGLMIRRMIKELKNKGVEVVVKKSINKELFQEPNFPSFPTLTDKKKYLQNYFIKFREHTIKRSRNIQLPF